MRCVWFDLSTLLRSRGRTLLDELLRLWVKRYSEDLRFDFKEVESSEVYVVVVSASDLRSP